MTKIDVFSGFLGAGKTTLIKKLIGGAYGNEKLVLIENEFGEIGIDGGFLKDAGVAVNEINSGCICCSLVGDFGRALAQVAETYHPDRILIEPSGVGKLSDVVRAVENASVPDSVLNATVAVVDAKKCKMYMKNFGEFFNDQVGHANTLILSHTAGLSEEKLVECVALLREHNPAATVITTDWDALEAGQILDAMEKKNALADELAALTEEAEHHHHHDHDDECDCGCHEHHHHHDHDDECDCGCHEHHHHHDHDDECDCGCHEHHHHHADEVFGSWGVETAKKFKKEEISAVLNIFASGDQYGMILRAKGIVEGADGAWIHFDYVPGEPDVRTGSADVIGRLCVIGSGLNSEAIARLFGVN